MLDQVQSQNHQLCLQGHLVKCQEKDHLKKLKSNFSKGEQVKFMAHSNPNHLY
jgi:hypothetical protein